MLNWWLRLIEPAKFIQEPEQRQRAQLLNGVVLVALLFDALAILLTLSPAVRVVTQNTVALLVAFEAAGIVGLAAAYQLNRTGRYRAGAVLLVITVFATTYASSLLQGGAALGIGFLVAVVLMCSLFLSWRASAFTLAGTIVAVLLLLVLEPQLPVTSVIVSVFLLAYTGALILVAAFLQERDRQQMARQTRALRETSQRLTSVMQSAGDAIISFNDRGYIVSWNPAAETLFGMREYEALGRPISVILPERLRAAFEREVENVRASNQPQHLGQRGEFAGLRQNGAEFPVEISLAAWPAEGQLYFTGFVRDVSERQQAHLALQEAHARLQQTVDELRERTRAAALLAEMGELLQACTTPAEAHKVIASSVAKLFPGSQGALYLISPSYDVLEAALGWDGLDETEEQPAELDEASFRPDQCWALRRGRVHAVSDTEQGLLCRHLGEPLPRHYVCAPMIAQGESLGVLYIAQAPAEVAAQAAPQANWDEHLAARAAEHIALALANIRLRDTLRRQSIRDPLTELHNRRFLEETLAREIRRSERSQRPLSMIMFDLDRFKAFNDSHGRAAGDSLLRELGAHLAETFRGGDVACRFGGEEFVVLLLEAPLAAALERAEGLRQRVQRLAVQQRGRVLNGITASFGVAEWQAGWDGEELIRAVDAALHMAKINGRDRVESALTTEPVPE